MVVSIRPAKRRSLAIPGIAIAMSLSLFCAGGTIALASQVSLHPNVVTIPIAEAGYPVAAVSAARGSLWLIADIDASPYTFELDRVKPDGEQFYFNFGEPGPSPPPLGSPKGITIGPDGNIWYTITAVPYVARMTPRGTQTLFGDPGLEQPYGIAVGADQNLWLADPEAETIDRVTPEGSFTDFSVPHTFPQMPSPTVVALGSDGDIYFNRDAGEIEKVDVHGQFTLGALPRRTEALRLALGADGNMWYLGAKPIGSASLPVIGYVTPDMKSRQWRLPANAQPVDIALGRGGRIWVADSAYGLRWIAPDGTMGGVRLPGFGPNVFAKSLTYGSDGAFSISVVAVVSGSPTYSIIRVSF